METSMQQQNVFYPGEYRPRNRVRELRESKLMTQAQLAKRAKLAVRTIQSIEKGMRCRMFSKRKILLALDLTLSEISQVFSNGGTRNLNAES